MYITYIYNKNRVLLTQIFEMHKLDIRMKRNDVDTASFFIKNKEYFSYNFLKEGNKIKIFRMVENKEKLLFSGIISGIKAGLDEIQLYSLSEVYLLKKKINFHDKTYSNLDILARLQSIQQDINQREGGFISHIDCDVSLTVAWWEVKQWKTWFDVLRDLAWESYDFDYWEGTLFFKQNLWKDKSSGSEMVAFNFNLYDPWGNNISKTEVKYDIKNIANYIIGEDGTRSDWGSIWEFWVLEQKFSKWNKEDLIEEYKYSLKEYTIIPTTNDFFLCDIGDSVCVDIDNWNDIIKFNWKLKVIEKQFKSWDLDTLTLKLSTNNMRSKNIFETISQMQSSIKNLEL